MLSRLRQWLDRFFGVEFRRDVFTVIKDFALAVVIVTFLRLFTLFVDVLGLTKGHGAIIKEVHFWYSVALLVVLPVKTIITIWLNRARRE